MRYLLKYTYADHGARFRQGLQASVFVDTDDVGKWWEENSVYLRNPEYEPIRRSQFVEELIDIVKLPEPNKHRRLMKKRR